MTPLPQNPDVIVVGAGAAGLAAAQALRGAGLDTLVLEAAGHIGGRCATDTTSFSVPFDRGASWLHSAPINPLAAIAQAKGARLHKAPWTRARARLRGRTLTVSEVRDYQKYLDTMWPAITARGAQSPDTTPRAVLPPGPWTRSAVHDIAQMIAGEGDVTSARDVANYANAPGDWLVEGGLGTFMTALHRDVPVALACPVSKITHAGTGVRVSTPRGEVAARHLVMTVSTGVLAAGSITFDPPLPADKRDAIAQLPNGLLNKVGIEFSPKWRGACQGEVADFDAGDDAFCSIFFGFFDSPLAVGFVAGRCADALEAEGAGAATDFCLQGLRAVFGHDVTKHVVRTDETAWRADPLARGAYSYATTGNAGARAVLAAPLADRIFFAGEATMTDSYSTVHGAYQSGQRAAQDIIATYATA